MPDNLSRLKTVDPREVWSNEPNDFTPWLKENIDCLGEALGIDIQQVEREVPVGPFSADLVGEEAGTSRAVIVENQLEKSNHTHLGQILTYAAGRLGSILIWVAPTIQPEHRRALEWLNETTKDSVDYYGVEVRVVTIEGSELKAPDFRAVVKPKTTKSSLTDSSGTVPSPRNLKYQTFFQELLNNIKERDANATNRSESPARSQIEMPTGRRGFSYWLRFTKDKNFYVELHIDTGSRDENKRAFRDLEYRRNELEESLGAKFHWQYMEKVRSSKIQLRRDRTSTIDDENDLDALRQWIVDSFIKLREVFNPIIRTLDIQPSIQGEIDEETDVEAAEDEE